MLSTSKNFLFIHVPKTAGNSVQDALRQHSDDAIVALARHQDGVERFELRSSRYRTVKHSTFADYEREYGPQMMAGLFKFACVRNPWDRCMSYYFSPHRGPVVWDRREFIDFVHKTVRPLASHFSRPGQRQPLGQAIANLDFVVRHECLQDDFDRVCQRLGLPPMSLPRRNRSPQADHRRLYDADSVALVEALFRDEIECFGYRFDRSREAQPA